MSGEEFGILAGQGASESQANGVVTVDNAQIDSKQAELLSGAFGLSKTAPLYLEIIGIGHSEYDKLQQEIQELAQKQVDDAGEIYRRYQASIASSSNQDSLEVLKRSLYLRRISVIVQTLIQNQQVLSLTSDVRCKLFLVGMELGIDADLGLAAVISETGTCSNTEPIDQILRNFLTLLGTVINPNSFIDLIINNIKPDALFFNGILFGDNKALEGFKTILNPEAYSKLEGKLKDHLNNYLDSGEKLLSILQTRGLIIEKERLKLVWEVLQESDIVCLIENYLMGNYIDYVATYETNEREVYKRIVQLLIERFYRFIDDESSQPSIGTVQLRMLRALSLDVQYKTTTTELIQAINDIVKYLNLQENVPLQYPLKPHFAMMLRSGPLEKLSNLIAEDFVKLLFALLFRVDSSDEDITLISNCLEQNKPAGFLQKYFNTYFNRNSWTQQHFPTVVKLLQKAKRLNRNTKLFGYIQSIALHQSNAVLDELTLDTLGTNENLSLLFDILGANNSRLKNAFINRIADLLNQENAKYNLSTLLPFLRGFEQDLYAILLSKLSDDESKLFQWLLDHKDIPSEELNLHNDFAGGRIFPTKHVIDQVERLKSAKIDEFTELRGSFAGQVAEGFMQELYLLKRSDAQQGKWDSLITNVANRSTNLDYFVIGNFSRNVSEYLTKQLTVSLAIRKEDLINIAIKFCTANPSLIPIQYLKPKKLQSKLTGEFLTNDKVRKFNMFITKYGGLIRDKIA